MAAPTPTARNLPVPGVPLQNGYQTLLTCEADDDISFWEKQVTPPGIEGGDPVDFSTMHNTTWVTIAPGTLLTLTECSMTAGYNPEVIDQILLIINVNTVWTVTFPNGGTTAFHGFLRNFTPAALVRDQHPEANITVVPTNWDGSSEQGPVTAGLLGT